MLPLFFRLCIHLNSFDFLVQSRWLTFNAIYRSRCVFCSQSPNSRHHKYETHQYMFLLWHSNTHTQTHILMHITNSQYTIGSSHCAHSILLSLRINRPQPSFCSNLSLLRDCVQLVFVHTKQVGIKNSTKSCNIKQSTIGQLILHFAAVVSHHSLPISSWSGVRIKQKCCKLHTKDTKRRK